jgi:dipeptidyl aminopeptidase/acylaminoacyl peptidase
LATETVQLDALWRVDLVSAGAIIEKTADPGCAAVAPSCSPDGRRHVFVDLRTGVAQIWTANADGSDERPLLKSIPALHNPEEKSTLSTVSWSPDGKWIAFTVFGAESNADIRFHLYLMPATGGAPRRLGKAAYALWFPIWSPDSASLYATQDWPFEDNFHQHTSIVRVGVENGSVTSLGASGIWPRLSHDGRFVYFFSSPYPKLFRIPSTGGTVELLADTKNLEPYSAAVGSQFLYLFQRSMKHGSSTYNLLRFDPETRAATPLAEIPFNPRSAYLSRDERFLYLEETGDSRERVVIVENLP